MRAWAWFIPGFFLVLGVAFLGYALTAATDIDRATFLIIGISFVGSALFVMAIYGFVNRSFRAARRLQATGKPAMATILSVEDTGVTVNDNPRVHIKLRVRPTDGPEFDIDTKKVVSWISVPQPGSIVPIKYDPADPDSFVWDNASPATAAAMGASPPDYEQMIRQALAMKGVTGPLADQAVNEAMAQIGSGQHIVDLRKYTQPDGAPAAYPGQAQPVHTDPAEERLERLKKLGELRDSGVLTSSEFEVEKARILAGL